VFVCSLNYLASNAHAPYCPLWPVWLHHTFSHYSIKGTIFGKMLLNIKFVFCFCATSDIFLIRRRIQPYSIINISKSSHKSVTVIFLKIEFYRQIFEKNIQTLNFMKIRPGGAFIIFLAILSFVLPFGFPSFSDLAIIFLFYHLKRTFKIFVI
jgi:hypothetical protein